MYNSKVSIQEKNLVLKVANNVDRNIWDETKYYGFLDLLAGNREYQKEAILESLKFMCSGQYASTKQLAYTNFECNESIRDMYTTFENYEKKLHFSDKYTASIDLATGTGKSWVMYGIAYIMLAEKIVDRVLVLVPSVTIERELTEKFTSFACDDKLNSLLDIAPPRIINGSESITGGCICIENRDSIYKNSQSSILNSLLNYGEKTLLLSDEVHHVYYSDENEWKNFVQKVNFKYNIGLSGTCYYKDNSYFGDVIYRYSLRDAIEDGRVKSVEYISDGNMPTKNEDKWKVIINSHEEIKRQNSILPLTLVVTADINSCKKIAIEFKKFLKELYSFSDEQIDEKVLVIHSKADAAYDRIRLKSVDNYDSKVEWIFSVSMLTEGWDVKRVFQIVPHEERAFNSKLLIAQVLGRGLRIPNNWNVNSMGNPKVIVFNHAKWANSVKKLVDEVLEIEKKLSNTIIEDSLYNFDLINVEYSPAKTVTKIRKEGMYNLFDSGYIVLPTDSDIETINTNFIDINTNRARSWSTKISHKIYSIQELAEIMWYRFEDIPDDNNEGLCEKYQREWPINKLESMIKLSLEKSGNKYITEKLKQRFLSAMGVAFRQGNVVVDYQTTPDDYTVINTVNLKKESVSASSLRKEKVLFWSSNTENNLSAEEKEFFKDVIDTTNSYRQHEVRNLFDFKTPQSFVVADSDPEKEFIRKLISSENANIISWIKSNSSGFYSFEYSWKKGKHPQRGQFNPDFFIKLDERIIVVEIKGNEQINNPDVEIIGKHKAANSHFNFVNAKLDKVKSKIRYKFTMLTPLSYEVFFNKLASNSSEEIDNFVSDLDAAINNFEE